MRKEAIDNNAVDSWLVFLVGLFVTSLTAANFLAAKISLLGSIGGISILVPAGVVAYAVTFTVTDAISEVYGRRMATMVVRAGFVSQLFLIAFSWLAIKLPIAPFQSGISEVYNSLVASPPNIVIASLTAYLLSQHHDVWAFHYWREKTSGRHLWLRNNASTIVSQFIDTVVFITLAFAVLPRLLGGTIISWNLIPNTILGQYITKVIIALLDTPFIYIVVKGLRK